MNLFRSSKVGTVVKVTAGLLNGKYAMIAAEYEKGYGVITDPAEWPSEIPAQFNALFVKFANVVEVSEEEQSLVKVKFPNPKQFER